MQQKLFLPHPLKIFIYVKVNVGGAFIQRFILQMAPIVRAGPAGNQELCLPHGWQGLSLWAIFCVSQAIIRQLDQKQSSWISNWPPYGTVTSHVSGSPIRVHCQTQFCLCVFSAPLSCCFSVPFYCSSLLSHLFLSAKLLFLNSQATSYMSYQLYRWHLGWLHLSC